MLDYKTVLERANRIFAEDSLKDLSVAMRALTKATTRPKIESEEVKAILKALIEELNEQEQAVKERVVKDTEHTCEYYLDGGNCVICGKSAYDSSKEF